MPTILLTEDDNDQRALYRDVLMEAGYDIVEACSGSQALEEFRRKKPDIVVLDIQMPEMDGIEVLTHILEKDRQIPLVLHSAYPAYKANFLTWGADAFVVKSGDPAELVETVRRVSMENGVATPIKAQPNPL